MAGLACIDLANPAAPRHRSLSRTTASLGEVSGRGLGGKWWWIGEGMVVGEQWVGRVLGVGG